MNKYHCNYCQQIGADRDVDGTWYHTSCWEKMPSKWIFPSEFWRNTAQENFDKMIKPFVKDGRFYPDGKPKQ